MEADTSVNEEVRCRFFEAIETKSLEEFRELSAVYGQKVMSTVARFYNEEGSTPLLLAIRNGRLDSVKYLIDELDAPLNQTGRFLWEDEEYVEVPPLFAAIISDQLPIIKYLTSPEIPLASYDSYLPLFSASKNRSDKIDVLELMGAALLVTNNILLGRDDWYIGWRCWEEALKLREKQPKIPKNPHQPSDLLLVTMREPTSEFRCLKELLSGTVYSLKREEQGLLVSERILKQFGKDRSNLFLMYEIEACTSWFFNPKSSKLVFGMMELVESYQWNSKKLENAKEVCRIVRKLLSVCYCGWDYEPSYQFLSSFVNHMKALRFFFWYVSIFYKYSWLQECSVKIEEAERNAFNIIEFALRKLRQFSPPEKRKFRNCLSESIRKIEESSRLPATIIHWVCNLDSSDRYYFSSSFQKSDSIRFLLDAGVDPNTVDFLNTPLLILAKTKLESIDIECIKVLLHGGAHIDLVNKKGFSALNILKHRQTENYSEIFPLVNRVLPLKCFCANVIRKNGIRFERLPPAEQFFVRRHVAYSSNFDLDSFSSN